jgi:glycerol-3-phosphate dehydrogenase
MSDHPNSQVSRSVWGRGWRSEMISEIKSSDETWDLLIVGGGITGAGIYREATRRGLKVLLLEQQDFAWGTSSRSSKMVHGGLRYLGSGQCGLANDSVKERQALLDALPGLVTPLPFMMGHYKGVFPGPWIFNKLLAIYDYMAGKRYRNFFKRGIFDFILPGLRREKLIGVTQFGDAVTDDARLVLRVLHEGNAEGGLAINYLKASDTLKDAQGKVSGLKVIDQVSSESFELKAKAVVNASGAWTDELRTKLGADKVIRPLRGSHLVVPQWRLPAAYSVSFFHPKDKRPVFVFPWEGVSVIGTTDLDHKNDSSKESSITEEEVAYLLAAVNHQFPDSLLTHKDIMSSWSGVRPVVSKVEGSVDLDKPANPSDEKREHVVWDDHGMISVAGGKLTTYRLIALDVLTRAAAYLGRERSEFDAPSGFAEIVDESINELVSCADVSAVTWHRLKGRYGRGAAKIAQIIKAQGAFPEHCLSEKITTTDTLWAELVYACRYDSIQHLDDLLLRRTRLGLLLPKGAEQLLPKIKAVCFADLAWSDTQWQAEEARYLEIIAQHYQLPISLAEG